MNPFATLSNYNLLRLHIILQKCWPLLNRTYCRSGRQAFPA